MVEMYSRVWTGHQAQQGLTLPVAAQVRDYIHHIVKWKFLILLLVTCSNTSTSALLPVSMNRASCALVFSCTCWSGVNINSQHSYLFSCCLSSITLLLLWMWETLCKCAQMSSQQFVAYGFGWDLKAKTFVCVRVHFMWVVISDCSWGEKKTSVGSKGYSGSWLSGSASWIFSKTQKGSRRGQIFFRHAAKMGSLEPWCNKFWYYQLAQ